MAEQFTLENARIGFRNFKGEVSNYNRNGERTFRIFFNGDQQEELASDLEAQGYNIKRGTAPDGTPYAPTLSVAVAFGNFPPKVIIVNASTDEQGNNIPLSLDETNVETLDYSDLDNVDVVVRPYHWEMNGKTGVKAYLKAGYFSIAKDDFASKYGL